DGMHQIASPQLQQNTNEYENAYNETKGIISDMKLGLNEAAKQMEEIGEIDVSFQEIINPLHELNTGYTEIIGGQEQLSTGLDELINGLTELRHGLNQAADGQGAIVDNIPIM